MKQRPPEEIAAALEAELADDVAQSLRVQIAEVVPTRLGENGYRLSAHHQIDPSVAGLGFATMTEIAAELAQGAAQLFRAELFYPGAALTRQLIECGYLMSVAAERTSEAEEWMESSHDEIVARFMPRHLRNRSSKPFRLEEYQAHCDAGGHPNPAGRGLLRRHEEWSPLQRRWPWLDLAQHLDEIWGTFCEALPLYDPRQASGDPLFSPERSPDGAEEVSSLLAEWRKRDALADRL